MGELWGLVLQGGDVAIYGVLYYCFKINNRIDVMEVKHENLHDRVTRLYTELKGH